jgi:hypothetical protein
MSADQTLKEEKEEVKERVKAKERVIKEDSSMSFPRSNPGTMAGS